MRNVISQGRDYQTDSGSVLGIITTENEEEKERRIRPRPPKMTGPRVRAMMPIVMTLVVEYNSEPWSRCSLGWWCCRNPIRLVFVEINWTKVTEFQVLSFLTLSRIFQKVFHYYLYKIITSWNYYNWMYDPTHTSTAWSWKNDIVLAIIGDLWDLPEEIESLETGCFGNADYTAPPIPMYQKSSYHILSQLSFLTRQYGFIPNKRRPNKTYIIKWKL